MKNSERSGIMKKRIITAFLLISLLASLAFAVGAAAEENGPVIIVSSENAYLNEEVTLSVSVDNNPGVMSLCLGVDYDTERLNLTGIEEAGLTDLTVGDKIVWVGNDNSQYNGEIFRLRFSVIGNADPGFAHVSIVCGEDGAFNKSEAAVSFRTVGGGVAVFSEDEGLPEISMDTEYILLKPNGTKQLELKYNQDVWSDYVSWYVEDMYGAADLTDSIISIDETGTLTGHSAGTAYAVAKLEIGEYVKTVRCRIDVAENGYDDITGASLIDSKATVELFKTDFTKVQVLLERNNLLSAASLLPDEGAGSNGAAITGAVFTDPTVAGLFDLKVVDDRTLEIVPKDTTVAAAQENAKSIGKQYSSPIQLTVTDIDEGDERLVTGTLSIAVKQSKPKIKVGKITFNSYITEDTQKLAVSGGKVTAFEPDGSIPEWMDFDGCDTIRLLRERPAKPASGKLKLLATVEGWAVKAPVTVSYKFKNIAPKVKLSAKTVTLKPFTGDSVTLRYSISPAIYNNATVQISDEGVKGSYLPLVRIDNEKHTITISDQSFEGSGGESSKLTFKIHPVGGTMKPKTFTVTAKSLKVSDKVSMSLSAKGTIDLTIDKSPAVITPKLKKFHTERAYFAVTDIANAKTKVPVEITGDENDPFVMFTVEYGTPAIRITAKPGAVPGKYTATVAAYDCVTSELLTTKTVSFTVKQSAAAPAASATLKTKGAIDVVRPATAVTLTPNVKNLFDYSLDENSLVMGTMENKVFTPLTEDLFDVSYSGGIFTVKAKVGVSPLVKYYAALKVNDEVMSKPAAVKVVMKSAKITADVKTVSLLAKDRFSMADINLSCTDKAASGIERAELDAKSAELFKVTDFDGGNFKISYLNNEIPGGLGAGSKVTVKLNVFLEGNTTAKPNATISVKLTIK